MTENKKNNKGLHPSYHKLLKSSQEVAILTNICKNFVIEDEEFYNNSVTQENKHNPDFWINMAEHVSSILYGTLATSAMEKHTEQIPVIDYIMCIRYRAEMIDVLIPAIEQFLNKQAMFDTDD